jgi:hypothetical protein
MSADRPDSSATEAAERMLDKLRDFVGGLDADERSALGALFGPGVAMAYRDVDGDDVEGFALTWEPKRLPDHLAAVVRERDVRVTGL